MDRKTEAIECPACKNDSFLRREPIYEGFRRAGESLSCASCGHVFSDESKIPFKKKQPIKIFGQDDKPKPVQLFNDNDRPTPVKVFNQGENKKLCRYCEYYVVNPFIQRCARWKKEVEATDTCAHFTPKKQNNTPA